MKVSGVEHPADYFLSALKRNESYLTRPLHFLSILRIARINFDAHLAMRSLELLNKKIPGWVVSDQDVRLLLESSLWLGRERDLEHTLAALGPDVERSDRFLKLLAEYRVLDEFGTRGSRLTPTQMQLPALFLDNAASDSESEGNVLEARNSAYEALRFVPETDPRRKDIVAKLLRLEAQVRSAE
jgi:hypothetical protein